MTIHDFIKQRQYLVWHVSDYDSLDEAAIIEATLNYGTWNDVQELFKIVGVKKTADIFRARSRDKRTNYLPKIQHYFTRYFNKYA